MSSPIELNGLKGYLMNLVMTDIAQESQYLTAEIWSVFPVVWKSSVELTEATKEYKRAKRAMRAAIKISDQLTTEYMDAMNAVYMVNIESK